MQSKHLKRVAGCAWLASLPLFFGMSTCAAAQKNDDRARKPEIDQIVVVAHKDERSIRDVAANVTVVTRDALDAELATSLAEVFRYAPGIDYEAAGSRFGTEGINIRGIGGNRVALVLDGVPLSDQFSVGRFSNATRDFVDAGLIERVEVLHGPASALYGSSAIGGVVVVRTPNPLQLLQGDPIAGSVGLTSHSSDESVHARSIVAMGNDTLGVLAGVSVRDGHEMESAANPITVDGKDYRRRSGTLNIVADNRFGHAWRFGLIHQNAEVDSELRSVLGAGRFRSTTRLSGDDDYQMNLANVEYDFSGDDGVFSQAVGRAYFETVNVNQDTVDERRAATRPVRIDRQFHYQQEISGLELNLQRDLLTGNVGHQIGFGLEWTLHETKEHRDGTELGLDDGILSTSVLGENFPLRDFPVSETRELAAYVEDTLTLNDWTLVAALRAERYELKPEIDAIFSDDNPVSNPVSISETDVSPKLGLVYHATPSTDIYFQYAHGFRAPPFEDANIGLDIPLFNIRAIPNPDLRSESSNGFDLGLRWTGALASAHVGAFHTRYDDFIESKVRLGADPATGVLIFQSQNLSEATVEGLEASWRTGFTGALEGFDVDVAAYIARGRNDENGEDLNSVGPAQAVVGLGWLAPAGATSVRLRTTLVDSWSHRDETRGELFKPPGHAIVDLYVAHRLSSRMTLRASVRNLTDRTYWSWSDIRGLAPGDTVLPVLARAGRNLSVSFNMNW